MDQSVVEHPVTLIIKAPNQKYTDQTISCFLEWTVGKLKSHLSKVYPSKPSTKDQRLVYSGRLLPDHLQLKDVLRKQDEYHMVHLVCTSRTPPSSPKPSTSRESHGASTSSSSSNLDRFGPTAASPTNQEAPSQGLAGEQPCCPPASRAQQSPRTPPACGREFLDSWSSEQLESGTARLPWAFLKQPVPGWLWPPSPPKTTLTPSLPGTVPQFLRSCPTPVSSGTHQAAVRRGRGAPGTRQAQLDPLCLFHVGMTRLYGI